MAFPIRQSDRIKHLRFMVEWWSGHVLDLSGRPMAEVANPDKLAAVQAELASLAS